METLEQRKTDGTESELFQIRTANEWIAISKLKPMPKQLFGDLWLEGEIAILFADTGKGKSLLAVQIGESIASGNSISPLKTTAEAQKVLYFDFELDAKQFEMRYVSEPDENGVMPSESHYQFSENFSRIEINLKAETPKGFYTQDNYLRHSIEGVVKETGAKILIIDNITYLRHSNETIRGAVPLMREMKRLKETYGLSILVLAHTPKRDNSRPITVNDLQGSKALSNFADNIFAIGQSKLDPAGRYIKHIKPRSTGLTYDASNVLYFEIDKMENGLLGFCYDDLEAESIPETVHLADAAGSRESDLLDAIEQMYDRGNSLRQIAFDLKISKSRVHRIIKKWIPPATGTAEQESYEDILRREADEIEKTPAKSGHAF